MRIKRHDCEDVTTTEELFAHALTEDIAAWIVAWLGDMDPLGMEAKADIYQVICKRFEKGVEI